MYRVCSIVGELYLQIAAVSETLRCGIGKEMSVVKDMIVSCHRVLHVLQKDEQEFDDHVTHVSTDIRNYVSEQRQRVADDANVLQRFWFTAKLPLFS